MLKKINHLLQKPFFPFGFKIISLLAYIALIIIGLLAYSDNASFLKELRNTNLGNLIVWSVWWPAIVLMSIFFGRIWCMVCPVEIITSFFAKIGFKLKRPKWILSGWAITIFYIIILFVGIQQFAIHRNPFFMSMYLLSIVLVSVIIGLIYEKNTFCRYFCPVGYMLGLYSKLSFFGWRVKNTDVCKTCKDKSCIQKNYRYNLNEKSCGVDLYPADIVDNSNCILCAGCMKTCKNYQSEKNELRPNPEFQYIGFASDLMKVKPLKLAEMVFVLVVSGFVISEIWSEWKITDEYLSILPDFINSILFIENKIFSKFISSFIIFGIIPFIIWTLPFLVSKIVGFSISFKNYVLQFGLAFIPIIAAAHLDKAILKFTSRLPYFKNAFSDVTGIETAQKIIDKQILVTNNPIWINVLVSILLTIVMIGGILLSVKVIQRLNMNLKNEKSKSILMYLIPTIYGGIFLIMIIFWRWII